MSIFKGKRPTIGQPVMVNGVRYKVSAIAEKCVIATRYTCEKVKKYTDLVTIWEEFS